MSNAILDNKEPPIGLAEAGRGIERNPATITRWILSGCTAADGSRVKLDGLRVGYKWCTSAAALNRFFARLSAVGDKAHQHQLTAAERDREFAAANRECEAVGA